jgi:hypothetical protein
MELKTSKIEWNGIERPPTYAEWDRKAPNLVSRRPAKH